MQAVRFKCVIRRAFGWIGFRNMPVCPVFNIFITIS